MGSAVQHLLLHDKQWLVTESYREDGTVQAVCKKLECAVRQADKLILPYLIYLIYTYCSIAISLPFSSLQQHLFPFDVGDTYLAV